MVAMAQGLSGIGSCATRAKPMLKAKIETDGPKSEQMALAQMPAQAAAASLQ
jgi:hypothetical protein